MKKLTMKKLTVILLAVCLAAIAAFGLAACNQEDVITVYTEAGFAPFEYVSDGKIVGVDVDIMNLVGEKLGKKVVFENVEFAAIIDAVHDGKLANVGAAGISVTDERKEKVDFSKEYYTAKLYVIYKTEVAATYESTTTDNVTGIYWDSLAGKKIAVQTGTTADLFLSDELAGADPADPKSTDGVLYGTGASVVQCGTLAVAKANVGTGDADVFIIDELPAQQLIAGDANYKCSPLYYKGADGAADEAATDTYAICGTPGQTELLNAINAVLDELGADGIQQLVNKHFNAAA